MTATRAAVRVERIGNLCVPDMARELYKQSGLAIDRARKDPMITISAHDLFDLVIAYEAAIKGDTGDLEWALAVQAATAKGAVEILEEAERRRFNKGDFDSKAAQLYGEQPYYRVLKRDGEEGVLAAGKEAFLAITNL